MRCPFCQHTDSRVLESRSAESAHSVRRRRECLRCDRRFTTYERIEFVPIAVLKRRGDRESFDRSKILLGVTRACEKTGITATQIESLVDEIEADLQQRVVREVTSQEIGELVLLRLQGLSEVAYIRFASVYRKFQGIRDFTDTLNQLQGCSVISQPIIGDQALASPENNSSPMFSELKFQTPAVQVNSQS
jgi:transcriptional repressor NrdR